MNFEPMKEENHSIDIWKLPMVRCCVCGELTSSWHSTADNLQGLQFSIGKALQHCFDFKFLWPKTDHDEFICDSCEMILLTFENASQEKAQKRNELQQRFINKGTCTQDNEFIILIESVEEEQLVDQSEEDVHQSDEFVKVSQPEEQFEDAFSEDFETIEDETFDAKDNSCINNFGNIGYQGQLITIERVKTRKRLNRYCWQCSETFSSQEDFQFHRKRYHAKIEKTEDKVKKLPHKCVQCRRSFYSKQSLEDHVRRTHAAPNSIWHCKLCEQEFDSYQPLEEHNIDHGKVTCIKCGKSFKTAGILQRHMQIHTEVKRYQCKYCNILYHSDELLKKHKCRHKRNFVCPVCDFKFCTAWNLKRHRRLNCLPELNRRKLNQLTKLN